MTLDRLQGLRAEVEALRWPWTITPAGKLAVRLYNELVAMHGDQWQLRQDATAAHRTVIAMANIIEKGTPS